jgi:23S rRNA pseudouridine1911/1915/1917 synthase
MNFRNAIVNAQSAGTRLDLFLTRCLANLGESREFSRSGIQKLIAEGQITLNGKPARASTRVKCKDFVAIKILPPKSSSVAAEPIPLNVLYEDDDCIVINKAPGMVVHPAAGTSTGTLVHAILHHCPDLHGIGGESRPGIVHRLDKDTSGVMIVAKNTAAFHELARQFKERRVKKEYLALVFGKPKDQHGIIDRPIGRHRSDRKRMSSLYASPRKREAITEWVVEKSFRQKGETANALWVSLLRLMPRTGRTHQIRVHLSDMGYPLVGDQVYGRKKRSSTAKESCGFDLESFPRQALHAERLSLFHPRTGDLMEFCAPVAADIQNLLRSLERLNPEFGEVRRTIGVDKGRAFT